MKIRTDMSIYPRIHVSMLGRYVGAVVYMYKVKTKFPNGDHVKRKSFQIIYICIAFIRM